MRLSAHSEYLIDLLNKCLTSDPQGGDAIWEGVDLSSIVSKHSLNIANICPTFLRGVFHNSRDDINTNTQASLLPKKKEGRDVPNKILVFPGSDITRYLILSRMKGDGRHYGVAMFLPFLRSIQGISQEYAHRQVKQATASTYSSLNNGGRNNNGTLDVHYMSTPDSLYYQDAWNSTIAKCKSSLCLTQPSYIFCR
jgi:hypothetical protein